MAERRKDSFTPTSKKQSSMIWIFLVKNFQQAVVIKLKIKKPFSTHGIIKYHTLELSVFQKLPATKEDIRFFSKINFY